jgi:uncharacterized protein YukE
MQPLPFPTAAVQAAAEQCRSMATLVDERMVLASTAAVDARAGWAGAYADDFGIAWPDTELSATELPERLRRLAGELDDAVTAAADENTRRAGLRADWDCQHDPDRPRNVPC